MLSKIVQRTTFSPWSESLTLPFCSPRGQEKNAARIELANQGEGEVLTLLSEVSTIRGEKT
jgi:hypothetical protein